jgi:hypothetical protein
MEQGEQIRRRGDDVTGCTLLTVGRVKKVIPVTRESNLNSKRLSAMKRIAILFVLISAAFSSAFAEIGDTPQQCQQRYGPSTKVGKSFTYYKDTVTGYEVAVSFYEGKVDSITYNPIKEIVGRISDSEIERLLKINAGGRKWKKMSDDRYDITQFRWQTEDGELIAVYAISFSRVSVATKGYNDRAPDGRKAENLGEFFF